jgi:hypothetical protein
MSLQVKRTCSPVISSTEIPTATEIVNELPYSPPRISLEHIEKMTDITTLSGLETKYDEFLDKNSQILLLLYLDNIIDEFIEIRNALTARVSRLHRERQMRTNIVLTKEKEKEKQGYYEYNHSYQSLLPLELQLTQQQIMDGYIPCPNEPKEFKCGCLSIKYYAQCFCKNRKIDNVCMNQKCNEKAHPLIKVYSYCDNHNRLKRRLDRLELETEKVRKELLAIKHQSNSLDYEDYKNSLSKNKRRVSRFPWKNISI